MHRHSVWQSLDRLSFCENAILLDITGRSQGRPTRTEFGLDEQEFLLDGDLSPQMVRDFLDDFALVAAGNGGKDNVSATCIEIRDQDKIVTVRVAKNEALDERTKMALNRLARLMTKSISIESQLHQIKEEILLEILDQCTGRLFKHIERFTNELRDAQCRPANEYRTPNYSAGAEGSEAAEDVTNFGRHDPENHELYMRTCEDRLDQLRELSSELAQASGESNLQNMMLLTKTAYDIRRSSSFRQFLKSNLQKFRRVEALTATVDTILERLGKMSRFYRAALTFTAVGVKLLEKKMTIQVQDVPAPKFQITELHNRTPAQLGLRGGPQYSSCRLRSMISRWPNYRMHSEMQLLVFYQEYPDLVPRDSYIGCDKLSCYLCHSFITNHGQFRVKGCHQSLYSLWIVPGVVAFESEERAEIFCNALRALCDDLEHKMIAMRNLRNPRKRRPMNNESVANLSRLSLPLTISRIEQWSELEPTSEEILPDGPTPAVEGDTLYAPRNSLTIIPEVPLRVPLQDNAEPDPQETSEPSQLVKETGRETETLEFDVTGNAPIPTDVASNCGDTGGDKGQKMRPANRSSKHCKQRHRSNKGQLRCHVPNGGMEEKSSARRARHDKQFSVYSQHQGRHPTEQKARRRTKWRDAHGKDQARGQGRPRSSSARMVPQNQGILGRFWLTCTILVRGCFGEPQKSR